MPNLSLVIAKMKKSLACKTDVELAEALGGISPSTISTWKKRNTIPYDKVEEVSEQTNIPFAWFVTDEDDGPGESAPSLIPILKRISPNFPSQTQKDDYSGQLSVPGAPQGAFALILHDESMAPTIRQGDYLLFLPSEGLQNGELAVYQDEWGQVSVRRYRERDGRFFLVSDNPAFTAVEASDDLRIIGKVIGVWREIKI